MPPYICAFFLDRVLTAFSWHQINLSLFILSKFTLICSDAELQPSHISIGSHPKMVFDARLYISIALSSGQNKRQEHWHLELWSGWLKKSSLRDMEILRPDGQNWGSFIPICLWHIKSYVLWTLPYIIVRTYITTMNINTAIK